MATRNEEQAPVALAIATGVGPVLRAGEIATAVIAAIRELCPLVVVLNRGSYLRVIVPQRCELQRSLVEKHLGAQFLLPQDLELVMIAFAGSLWIDHSCARWEQ